MTRDPIGYEGSQWSLFEYAASNPCGFIDPLGLELDSVNHTIWQSILRGQWRNALDLIDDVISCTKDPRILRQFKVMRQAVKYMQNLDKWRKQMQRLSLKDKKKILSSLRKTLERHLEKRDGIHTPETRRIMYQIKWLEEIIP